MTAASSNQVLTVLLVEDHDATRQAISVALHQWEHKVYSTASAIEALDVLAQHPEIQLMITDWLMPDIDGLELCRLARSLQREHYLHILVLTARKEGEELLEALEAGADSFLEKSINLSVLRSVVRAVQRTAYLEQQLSNRLGEMEQAKKRLQEQNLELEKRNEELGLARSLADQASLAKGEFLANMSHEIRTPMHGVLGMVRLLKGTPLNGEQKEFVGLIDVSAQNLLTIVNDVLDFSKIEAGKLELESAEFSLEELISLIVGMLLPQAQEHSLSLLCRIDRAVPDRLTGDAGRLRQILVNLVSNAIKFTSAGHVLLQVDRVPALAAGTRLRFTISDTGIGIAEDKKALIFQAFHQGDSSVTRRFGGTGLGLAICSRLIALMDGKIDLTSELGQGTAVHFELEFPATPPEEARPTLVEGGAAPPPSSSPQLTFPRDGKVLVVAEHPLWREIVRELLQEIPLKVEEAASMAEARQVLAASPNDWLAVLADRWSDDAKLAHTKLLVSSRFGETERADSYPLRQPVTRRSLQASLQEAFDQKSPPATPEMPPPRAVRQLQVLVAEDNVINQVLMSRMLEKFGHTVTLANNGVEAVEKFRGKSFDLILMDLQMPEMGGLEATVEIRRMETASGSAKIPIVALTARVLETDQQSCRQAGMDAYLAKPLQFAELEEILQGIENK